MRILVFMLALVPILASQSKSSRPTAPPTAEEVWHLTLPEAIKIGLANTEEVRCIRIGSQEIPLGGFEPNPAFSKGTLSEVYDPALVSPSPR